MATPLRDPACVTLVLLLGAVCLYTRAPLAAAEPNDKEAVQQAKALATSADQQRVSGDLQGALQLYLRAYQVHPTPYLFWPQAELYLAMGKPVEGLAALRSHREAFGPEDYPTGRGPAAIVELERKLQAQFSLNLASKRHPAPGTDRQVLLRKLGYSALGSAGLFLVGGAIAQGVRESYVYHWNSDECLADGLTRDHNCMGLRSSYEQAGSAAIAVFVLGGVLSVTSASLLLVSRPRLERRLVSWACLLDPGSVGVACAGTF